MEQRTVPTAARRRGVAAARGGDTHRWWRCCNHCGRCCCCRRSFLAAPVAGHGGESCRRRCVPRCRCGRRQLTHRARCSELTLGEVDVFGSGGMSAWWPRVWSAERGRQDAAKHTCMPVTAALGYGAPPLCLPTKGGRWC